MISVQTFAGIQIDWILSWSIMAHGLASLYANSFHKLWHPQIFFLFSSIFFAKGKILLFLRLKLREKSRFFKKAICAYISEYKIWKIFGNEIWNTSYQPKLYSFLITYRLGRCVLFYYQGHSRAYILKMVRLSFLAFFVHCETAESREL